MHSRMFMYCAFTATTAAYYGDSVASVMHYVHCVLVDERYRV